MEEKLARHTRLHVPAKGKQTGRKADQSERRSCATATYASCCATATYASCYCSTTLFKQNLMEAQSNWTGRKAWEQFSTGCFLSASHTRRGKVYPVAHTKNCISLHIRFDPIYPHMHTGRRMDDFENGTKVRCKCTGILHSYERPYRYRVKLRFPDTGVCMVRCLRFERFMFGRFIPNSGFDAVLFDCGRVQSVIV
jgi:hypothetical protein